MTEIPAYHARPLAIARPQAAGWRGALHLALLIGFLAYVFIGTQPFGDPSAAQRVDGNPLDRVAVLGLFALALAALAVEWRATVSMVPRALGLALVVGFCLASVFWSDHPDLTVRRGILLVMLTVVAAGCAAGVTDLRRFHTVLFAALVGIVLLNILATAAAPGVAITDLGVRGIYSQKNVAGIVAMIAAVTAATWTLGARDPRRIALGLVGLALILLFLLATRSKTSIALTLLAFGLIACAELARRFGPRFVALAAGFAALGGAGLLAAFAASGFDPAGFAAVFTGDASFTGRDELWAFALDRAGERPWLGRGYGAFWDVGPGADPLLRVDPGSWLGDIEIGTINQAHNGYLELWLQIGLPATVLAAMVVVVQLLVAARWSFSARASLTTAWANGLLTLILMLYLLHNLTEATLFIRGVPFCNISLLAMFVSMRSRALVDARGARGKGD